VITGSIPYAVYYADSGKNLSQNPNVVISGGALGIGLVPNKHSLHMGWSMAPDICLDTNSPGTQQRQIQFASNSVPRWQIYSPVQAEQAGTNTASDLSVIAINDANSASRSVLYLTRASGNVTVGPPGGDQGARLVVTGDAGAQAVIVARGAQSGQNVVIQAWQIWQGAPTNNWKTVASIDQNGNFFSVSGGSAQVAYSTNPFGLVQVAQPIPGMALTLSQAGTYLVTVVFVVHIALGNGNYSNIANLFMGGTAIHPAITITGPDYQMISGTGQYVVSASAGAVLIVQGQASGPAGGQSAADPSSSISALLIH
jgi:hypothetical protein